MPRACGDERRVAIARELTKLYEEVWRGTLGEAVGHVGAKEPRGEYVLVVEGAPPPAAVDDDALESAVARELASGASARDAAAAVVRDLGVPKRRAYDVAVRLRAETRPGN